MGQRKLCLQYYLEYCHYMWRRRLIAATLVCLVIYWYKINQRKRKSGITYAPMIDRDIQRLRRLDRLYHGTEAHCISELRMRKDVFHRVCAELRSRALLEESFHVTIEQQVAMFIHAVSQNWSVRAIAFEKAKLCGRARRLLSKPIKFFHEIQELFTGSSADGSLARDQNTCMDNSDGLDSDDSRNLIDLNCYTQPEDPLGEDSNTLPTPTRQSSVDNSSSSNSRASKKRPRGSKSPPKNPPRNKSHFAASMDEIAATMKSLRETLAVTTSPQMPQLTDPHASLWQRLEAIPMTADQRVLVGEFLSTKKNKGKRSWLCNTSDSILHAWVFKFLCEKEGLN